MPKGSEAGTGGVTNGMEDVVAKTGTRQAVNGQSRVWSVDYTYNKICSMMGVTGGSTDPPKKIILFFIFFQKNPLCLLQKKNSKILFFFNKIFFYKKLKFFLKFFFEIHTVLPKLGNFFSPSPKSDFHQNRLNLYSKFMKTATQTQWRGRIWSTTPPKDVSP